jgi:hypothetical protein
MLPITPIVRSSWQIVDTSMTSAHAIIQAVELRSYVPFWPALHLGDPDAKCRSGGMAYRGRRTLVCQSHLQTSRPSGNCLIVT